MWRDKIKEIIYLLENSDVNEIEVTFWGRKFRVVKNPATVQSTGAPVLQNVPAPALDTEDKFQETETAPQETVGNGIEIKSPMPGTFYRASSPGADPFVNEGDVVKKGDTLCIIEAMKIMNEIEAESSGVITRIINEDGSPVEFDQPLFYLEGKS